MLSLQQRTRASGGLLCGQNVRGKSDQYLSAPKGGQCLSDGLR